MGQTLTFHINQEDELYTITDIEMIDIQTKQKESFDYDIIIQATKSKTYYSSFQNVPDANMPTITLWYNQKLNIFYNPNNETFLQEQEGTKKLYEMKNKIDIKKKIKELNTKLFS